jgi:toxin ParE1/3/4
MKYRLHPKAEEDILLAMDYIALDNPSAARKWHATIREKCRSLGETPGMDVTRTELLGDIRSFPVGSYLIMYRIMPGAVDILRILHSARKWQDLF